MDKIPNWSVLSVCRAVHICVHVLVVGGGDCHLKQGMHILWPLHVVNETEAAAAHCIAVRRVSLKPKCFQCIPPQFIVFILEARCFHRLFPQGSTCTHPVGMFPFGCVYRALRDDRPWVHKLCDSPSITVTAVGRGHNIVSHPWVTGPRACCGVLFGRRWVQA